MLFENLIGNIYNTCRKGRDEEKKEKRGPDNQTLLRLLEEGEQLHSMFRCARIQVKQNMRNNQNRRIY